MKKKATSFHQIYVVIYFNARSTKTEWNLELITIFKHVVHETVPVCEIPWEYGMKNSYNMNTKTIKMKTV